MLGYPKNKAMLFHGFHKLEALVKGVTIEQNELRFDAQSNEVNSVGRLLSTLKCLEVSLNELF